MAVVFQSYGSTSGSGSTGAVPKPAGTASGDLLLFIFAVDNAATDMIAPIGFTLGFRFTNSGGFPGHGMFWKVAGASEPASYSYALSPQPHCAAILRYTGADTASPINISGSSGGSSTTATAPSVTPTVSGGMLVCFFSTDLTKTPSASSPAMTVRVPYFGDLYAKTQIEDTAAPTSGTPSGTHSWTWTGATNWIASSFVIAPAGTPPPAPTMYGLATERTGR